MFIPFGVYHRLKGPITFNFFFIGGVFLMCQKRRFFALTADGGNLAPTKMPPLSTRRV